MADDLLNHCHLVKTNRKNKASGNGHAFGNGGPMSSEDVMNVIENNGAVTLPGRRRCSSQSMDGAGRSNTTTRSRKSVP